jgi:hypothetical protein
MAQIVQIRKAGDKLVPSQAERNAKRNLEMGPSMLAMARGLVKSTGRYVADGFKNVSKETHEKRLAICTACPSWEPGRYFGLGRCKQCGCSGIKLQGRLEVCPLSKWGGEE